MPDAGRPPPPTPLPLHLPLPRPSLSKSGRPQRTHQLPTRYRDMLPEPPLPAASESTPIETTSVVPRVSLIVRNSFRTAENGFGLWKEYMYRPSYDPDAFISAEDLYHPHSSTGIVPNDNIDNSDEEHSKDSTRYSNKSIELLLDWQNTGSSAKSDEEVNRLVHEVLLHPEFQPSVLQSFNATRENRKADTAEEQSPFLQSFQHANIDIDVPSGSKETPAKTLTIPGLYYRRIVTLIKEAFNNRISEQFHLTPFKLFRTLPGSEASERVYSEMYDSDVFLDEHDRVQRAPTDNPSCKREKIVVALMFWSDATHLAAFGTAKMWPIYMLFGNLSKYIRCKPNSGATKHLAYIPPFPNSLQDQLKDFHQKWGTQQRDILTHCRRELMHAVWKFLLDDEFLHAYKYGMVLQCQDGIERRIYPRIFTYSADYPEKYAFLFLYCVISFTDFVRVLLATIRDQGVCPCPRCLIPKSNLDRLGLRSDAKSRLDKARKYDTARVDKARKAIYELGKPINGVHVQQLLKASSAVPTKVSLIYIHMF